MRPLGSEIIFKTATHLREVTGMNAIRTGPVYDTIVKNLSAKFSPSLLEVVNESYKHSVPKGSESHFKVVRMT